MSQEWDHLDSVIKQVSERMKKAEPRPEPWPDDQLLAAYHEGGLTVEEAERLEAHLALCERCTEHIVLLSEMEDPSRSVKDPMITQDMVQGAKELVHQPPKGLSLRKGIARWFSSFIPLPALATASALLLLIVSIYVLYTPIDHDGIRPEDIRFGIIARVPSGEATRGKTPVYEETELKEGAVLRSKDRFRITFELREKAYVYVLALNSQGHLAGIFPEKTISSDFKAEPDIVYLIPRDGGWFQLDDHIGIERIFLLASHDPIKKIDQKIIKLKKSGIDKIDAIFTGITIRSFRFRHE